MTQLKQFFGAYFHQDWDVDVSQPEEVIENFLQHEPVDVIKDCASELRGLLKNSPDEKEWARMLFEEFGCYYDPRADGKNFSDWFQMILGKLENECNKKSGPPPRPPFRP